ncbi:sulfite exporter TauE/SafE family protein [Nesterenkonia natronophila]|uniref:Probable membrane transporter protein n=1 Tax=Nesterenkonia natronophila TaxID=2174932 RepID=A0A3A4FAW2_9MICC|nr:sulfite exporter TauE/SafE family protein [Nesterenkonia natronophila]RJN31934.1 sulfite exporter TauE/SafE family protein [Nesterenkonia natronophila]
MSTALIVTMVLAVGIGLSLGLLGGGGTILAVPLLAYVAGMPAQEAIAASMFIIGVTALISVAAHARRGNVRWRMGLLFGVASMIGAFGGGVLGSQLPGVVLMVAFGAMMIATALAMVLDRRTPTESKAQSKLPVFKIIMEGLVVGLVTGVVGAGGGFLVVPALVLLGGLPMSAAVGTSLLIISMKSFTGMAGYLTSVSIDWGPVLMITGVTVAGALIGAAVSSKVPDKMLKKAFGYMVLAMGVVVLLYELPIIYGLTTGIVIIITLIVVKVLQRRLSKVEAQTSITPAREAEASPQTAMRGEHRE